MAHSLGQMMSAPTQTVPNLEDILLTNAGVSVVGSKANTQHGGKENEMYLYHQASQDLLHISHLHNWHQQLLRETSFQEDTMH